MPDLDLANHGFTDADMDTEFDVGSFKAGPARMRLRDIVASLRRRTTRTLGAEYMYIADTATKRFFQGAWSRSARMSVLPPAERHISSSGSPPPRRSSATCTRSTSAEALLRARAATR